MVFSEENPGKADHIVQTRVVQGQDRFSFLKN